MPGYAKILLCGEGPQDMGANPINDPRTGQISNLEGWMQPLIRKLADDDAILDFIRLPRQRLMSMTGGKAPRLDLPGHAQAAYNAMRQAVLEDCSIVVFMVDNDHPNGRDRTKWRTICEQVWTGYKKAGQPVCGVACIPISASEAWLLADAEAWKQVGHPDCSQLPGNRAECIWGIKGDPDGNRPHEYFARMCRLANLNDNAPDRNLLAEHISTATLKTNCPSSFAPFAEAMEACLARHNCLTGFDFKALANEAPCQ